ncbi:hypothetical protein AMC99_00396 [Altererythrobacter epoxidivorans]|uniref:DUF3828 domain-containing protein n=1 Tax=Altererythrobacter epoxidivorans TaxID=361183 RepID=A0A0M4MRQ7_9SPHN|nr:hypothetical protein [Altererythrobacter epoxidivorans]ALE15708.1 hypothetical protein AMC99_00396 [Altererythrobacter epoxidivorans]
MSKLRKAFFAALALAGAPAAAQGAAGPQPEPPAYTDPLPTEPKEIVAAYLRDHTAWNDFASRYYEATRDFDAPEKAYRRLIDLYCGPEKDHQGITFSSDPGYDPERSEILEERADGGRRMVRMLHTNDNDFEALHEFVFVKRDGRWWLDELYYYDDYGDEWLPSL